MTRRGDDGAAPGPIPIELAFDYHCPYCRRVVGWLDGLEPEHVVVGYRSFALEQVNRDADAALWRLWEQPLDYEHDRGRRDRRTLAAFLATSILEMTGPAAVVRRFRRAVYAARFDERLDISDVGVLERAAVEAGAPPGAIADGLADREAVARARARLAADWAHLRSEYATFGVPTLRLPDDRPFYLRLERAVPPPDGRALLDAVRTFRRLAPDLLELKVPEAVSSD